MTEKPFQLKNPWIVWAIGICFILAGPANIAMALWMNHIADWFQPSAWLEFFTQMPTPNQIVCIAGPVAGVSLFIQRRVSWLFGIAVVVGACAQNLYCSFFVEGTWVYPIWIPLLANSSVLIVFAFFRYPYLDRRDRRFGKLTPRYPVDLPVQFEQFEGVTADSLSAEGCSLRMLDNDPLPPIDSVINIRLDGIPLQCQVRYHKGTSFGVRFTSPRRLMRAQIQKILLGTRTVVVEKKVS